MATRYKNETQIVGYDLVNELNDEDLAAGLMSWRDLASTAIQSIHTVDSQHPIIVEASRRVVYNTLPYDNLIYSFHMYLPS